MSQWGCFDGGAILLFEEEDFCDVLVLRVSGCITNLGGGSGRLDGGVTPFFEGGDCCNLLGVAAAGVS